MADITTPLKQFTDAVLAQEAAARKKEMVSEKTRIIEYHFKLLVFEDIWITRWNREGKRSNNSLRGSPEQPTLSQGASLISL